MVKENSVESITRWLESAALRFGELSVECAISNYLLVRDKQIASLSSFCSD